MNSAIQNFRDLPLLIKAIVIGLIIAPFGNFATTFSAVGIPGWYFPPTFIKLVLNVAPVDLAWNFLLLISGILLLQRRKLAWALSVIAILCALAANLYNWYYGTTSLNSGFFIVTSLSSLAMIGVLFYFRYPHLDRRDRWLSKNVRHPVTVKVDIHIPVKVAAMLINISESGALLEVPDENAGSFQVNGRIKFGLPTGKFTEGQIVRVSRKSVAVRFDFALSSDDLKF